MGAGELARDGAAGSEAVVRPRPCPGAAARLICAPYAGAPVAVFHPWIGLLPPALELNALQLPGRGRRIAREPHERLGSLVQELTRATAPILDRPFALFGHSLGALVCFELARSLRRWFCLEPALLVVSGHRAPHLPPRRRPIHELSRERFWEEVRRLNGTPPEVLEHPQLTELLEPVLRADFALAETYEHVPEAPLTCPILAFGGSDDPEVTAGDLAAWAEHTESDFSVSMFAGDHFFLHSQRGSVVRALVGALAALLGLALPARPREEAA